MMAKRDVPFDPKVVEAEESLLIDYQFLLHECMSKIGLSQSDLAERAGISKARLSQILSDGANPTVKTFAGIFHALGERVCISSVPLSKQEETARPKESEQLSDWQWTRPVRMAEPIDQDMIALMKNSARVEDSSTASNDNYSNRRITYFDSELATALLEPEPELEPQAA